MWINMVIGGEFKGPNHELVNEHEKYFNFSAQQ